MGDGRFRRESALGAGPAAEVPELPTPVEFEVHVTVTLSYTMMVKATTKKKAWDWAESLSWPRVFHDLQPDVDDVDPRAESLWRDGKSVCERQ